MLAVRRLIQRPLVDPAPFALHFDPHFRQFHFPDVGDRQKAFHHVQRQLRQRQQLVPRQFQQFPVKHFFVLEGDQQISRFRAVVTFAPRQSAVRHRPFFPLLLAHQLPARRQQPRRRRHLRLPDRAELPQSAFDLRDRKVLAVQYHGFIQFPERHSVTLSSALPHSLF